MTCEVVTWFISNPGTSRDSPAAAAGADVGWTAGSDGRTTNRDLQRDELYQPRLSLYTISIPSSDVVKDLRSKDKDKDKDL